MPHAVEQDDDETLINHILAGGAVEGLDEPAAGADLGEKANDAQDFGDIDDDDLAEDEDEKITPAGESQPLKDLLEGEPEDEGFDDLFGGDDLPSSPLADIKEEDTSFDPRQQSLDAEDDLDVFKTAQDEEQEGEEEEDDPEVREQRRLFDLARCNREERMRNGDYAEEPPPAPVTNAEVFSVVFPQFEANKPPRFGELLPSKRAHYLYKAPLKPPKSVQISKVNLEIQQDQEKAFKLPDRAFVTLAARKAEAEAKGLVLVAEVEAQQDISEDEGDFEIFDEEEKIGGVTWQDLVALCEDWDIPLADEEPVADGLVGLEDELVDHDGLFGENNGTEYGPLQSKKRKTFHSFSTNSLVFNQANVSFDEPQNATSKIARRVQLDLNDPEILVDIEDPNDLSRKRKAGGAFKRDAAGGLSKDFSRRYNISNDEAYDLLKENHQSKVRSVLGTVAIEHSLPAAKLQYPFYKVKLSPKEARTFHRPSLTPQPGALIFFDKPAFIKRKHLKGRDAHSLFNRSKDLSLGDNSNLLLLEYSEEYPIMLSGFGMGSKLINYYRRKDAEDTSRPKLDVGETAILMPQDRSPFSLFGDVERGQTVPTIHNQMFRAPVFKHEPSKTDFIISRNWTHVEGANWYVRNIENLHVVGQEFPLVEVPGTHSRKVTDAAKRRLRMLAWRMYKNHKRLKNEMILDHLPGSDIAANRSKMREFMDYDKDRGWIPRKNDMIPEESDLRQMVKPEDVCLLYSMQVGDRQLLDAGYNKDDEDMDVEEEDEETADLDKQLAPWSMTKNFLNACQGKAMLKLYGEGDPSGRGEAFNFIRTSMKGGFKEIGESIEDKLDAINKKKELGGHSYNVAKQQSAYNNAIKRIWDSQARSLSSDVEHDVDMPDVDDEPGPSSQQHGKTTSSVLGRSRRDDETASVYSRASTSADAGKVLRITRKFRDKYGREEVKHEIVRDSKVIREYQKRRRQIDVSEMSIEKMTKTGDAELDAQQQKFLAAELARLERNRDRRLGREKAKGITSAASPDSGAASPAADAMSPVAEKPSGKRGAAGGTQRKCANCGQVGHIKTNKKLCSVCISTSTPTKHRKTKSTPVKQKKRVRFVTP